jgi:hypothetical protein
VESRKYDAVYAEYDRVRELLLQRNLSTREFPSVPYVSALFLQHSCLNPDKCDRDFSDYSTSRSVAVPTGPRPFYRGRGRGGGFFPRGRGYHSQH